MILPVKIRVKQVSKEELFEAHRKEEVLTYCQRCSNYEKNHSCPDFDFDAVRYLEPYEHATVILTEIETQPIQSIINQLDALNFQSRVFNNYMKEESDEKIDMSDIVSMHAFEDIKNQMSDQLLLLEDQIDQSIGLPPGSCTRCAVCLKQESLACRFPEMLRYSLEALGFLVSEIYKAHFDMELGWAKGELPKQFCTCSVLMTKEKSDETLILGILEGMVLRINEEVI